MLSASGVSASPHVSRSGRRNAASSVGGDRSHSAMKAGDPLDQGVAGTKQEKGKKKQSVPPAIRGKQMCR